MTADYCRAIERHVCQKNDGHLIRIVGPAYEIVSRWEQDGIPLTIAFRGIDQYFERYHRTRQRRRPVRVEFCDTDVMEVFDQWRRALGLTRPQVGDGRSEGAGAEPLDAEPPRARQGPSLRAHLERAAERLSSARATGRIGPSADATLDQLSAELDRARGAARGLRGDARKALVERLAVLDRELVDVARAAIGASDRAAIEAEAQAELLAFRARMPAERYQRALDAAVDRLVRERLGLPVLGFA